MRAAQRREWRTVCLSRTPSTAPLDPSAVELQPPAKQLCEINTGPTSFHFSWGRPPTIRLGAPDSVTAATSGDQGWQRLHNVTAVFVSAMSSEFGLGCHVPQAWMRFESGPILVRLIIIRKMFALLVKIRKVRIISFAERD